MKLVIFDCDGTLVDSQHIIVAAMDQAFTQNGLTPLPRGKTLSIVGLSLPFAIEQLLPGEDPKLVHSVNDAFKGAFGTLRRSPEHVEPPYPGCMDCIRELSRRDDVVLGLATGKSRRGVDALFERLGLAPHFVTIQTADEHPSKPHPSMIRTAIAEAGVRTADTVMIGDTTYDIAMAGNAEVAGIGVAWGYHDVADLKGAGAHAIVHDYANLIPVINQLLNDEPQPQN
jgi:phosphoglycolate phosphatase